MSSRIGLDGYLWLRRTIASLLLVSAVWFLYRRSMDAPLIFDDLFNVEHNSSIRRLWPLVGTVDNPGPLHPPSQISTSGRPLVNLSLALNYHFGRLNPTGYHIFNIFVHALSALVLMAIVRRTLKLDCFGRRFERVSGPLAFVAALIWAVHPLQTEAVVYITQRTELMVGFFLLATLYASLHYWAAKSAASRWAWSLLAVSACAAGMACKEIMAVAPLLVLLFERTFVSGSYVRAVRNSWPLYTGLLATWGLLIVLNIGGPRSATAGFDLGIPLPDYWFTQAKVLFLYLKLVVWPWPLVIHYEMPYLSFSAAWPWVVGALFLFVATIIFLGRRAAAGFIGAWVFAILLPTLIVPISTEVAAERRMYLPLAAIVPLIVVGIYTVAERVEQRAKSRREKSKRIEWPMILAAGFAACMVLAFGYLDIRRLGAFQDQITLWQDTVENEPNDPLAHNNLGTSYLHAQRIPEAIAQYREAIKLNSSYPDAHDNLGSASYHSGQLPEAIAEYQRAIELKPNFAGAHYDLGTAYLETGQLENAVYEFEQAIRFRPAYAEARNNLGNAYLQIGRVEDALAQDQIAVRLSPENPEVHNNLGNALLQMHRVEEAIEQYQESLRIKPDSAEPHYNLGNVLFQAGKLNEAIEQYQAALRWQPNSWQTHFNLGVALFRMGHPKEAAESYERAARLKPDSLQIWFNLANAYAQEQRIPEALEAAEKSLELAKSQGQTAVAPQIEQWILSHRSEGVKPGP